MKKIIILLLLSFSIQAAEVQDACLKDLSQGWPNSSGIDAQLYRSLFLKESDLFCNCLENHFKKFEPIFGMSQYFFDDLERFKQEDYCRYENYQSGSFEVSSLITHQKLQEEIHERIRRRYMSAIWILASTESITAKFVCLEEKINTKCLKTGSGGVSFHCILSTMTNGKVMNELDSSCPDFKLADETTFPRI